MSYGIKLAQELKARNNLSNIGSVIGTVLSIEPLKVGILDNKIMLSERNSYICSSLKEQHKQKATVKIDGYMIDELSVPTKDDYNMELTYNDILHIDDKVLVIASSDNQTFFIVDKIEVMN